MTDFVTMFGRPPTGLWAAPGRVNLIGDHTDYHDGFVLPVAVDMWCRAWAAPRSDDLLRLHSVQHGSGGEIAVTDACSTTGWAAYPAGVAWALREAGVPVRGADVLVDSAVPSGAGLSSSAALTCSVGLALVALAGADVDRTTLALAARRAETEIVGAPVGVMDQMAVLQCESGAAMLLDCRSLQYRHVPLHLDRVGLRLLVVDTGVQHAHAAGGYAERRRESSEAARILGVSALRDATADSVADAAGRLGDVLHRRARHVVSENARVHAAAAVLDAQDVTSLGRLLSESHASLRDDYDVSCPELDVAVQAAAAAGAVGARMTGGGFGGSAIALVPSAAVAPVRDAVVAAAAEHGFSRPTVMVPAAGGGARRVVDELAISLDISGRTRPDLTDRIISRDGGSA